MINKILFLLLVSFSLNAQVNLNPAQVTNIAAKQRMYSQRLAKSKISKAYFIDVENAQKEITMGLIIFEENLKILGNYNASPEYKQKIDRVASLWTDYAQYIKSDDNSSINKIYKNNTELLDACNDVVKELNSYFKSKGTSEKTNYESQVSEFAATSGRLRYLSQRLALYYVYAYKNNNKSTTELKSSMDLFETTLTTLLTCQFNNSEIDENISKIYSEWNKLKNLTSTDGTIKISEKSIAPEIMMENCNKILSLGEKLTGMYVSLLK